MSIEFDYEVIIPRLDAISNWITAEFVLQWKKEFSEVLICCLIV